MVNYNDCDIINPVNTKVFMRMFWDENKGKDVHLFLTRTLGVGRNCYAAQGYENLCRLADIPVLHHEITPIFGTFSFYGVMRYVNHIEDVRLTPCKEDTLQNLRKHCRTLGNLRVVDQQALTTVRT